jgi:hypothetical protein
MDKFEQLIDDVSKMSTKDQAKVIEEYKGSCVCPTCPTWNKCADDANEKLFCVTGKSIDCISEIKGCMCPTCPLAQSLGVGTERNTFCIRGSEMEQRGQ